MRESVQRNKCQAFKIHLHNQHAGEIFCSAELTHYQHDSCPLRHQRGSALNVSHLQQNEQGDMVAIASKIILTAPGHIQFISYLEHGLEQFTQSLKSCKKLGSLFRYTITLPPISGPHWRPSALAIVWHGRVHDTTGRVQESTCRWSLG